MTFAMKYDLATFSNPNLVREIKLHNDLLDGQGGEVPRLASAQGK